jgi:hypothetical protein
MRIREKKIKRCMQTEQKLKNGRSFDEASLNATHRKQTPHLGKGIFKVFSLFQNHRLWQRNQNFMDLQKSRAVLK